MNATSPAPRATASRPTMALVVDDHPVMAGAVMTAVAAMRIFQRVMSAGSLAEAELALQSSPTCSLVILDMQLGDATGRDGLTRMREAYPDIPVLVFSSDASVENITMAFDCNARGYVTKTSPMPALACAIQAVLAGGCYVPPEAVSILGLSTSTSTVDAAPARPSLSGRQEQVLQLLLLGMPNKVIASRLSMAEGTVKAHLNAVFRALGARTRVEALLRARELGLG